MTSDARREPQAAGPGNRRPIEDYAFIGNCVTGALVARDGALDWLCLPRFDADACFAALLGSDEHGRWQIAPEAEASVHRRYVDESPVLETSFETADGRVTVIDFLPPTDDEHYVSVMRLVRGEAGRVPMRMTLRIRTGYGRIVPWVRRVEGGISAVAGPDALRLTTPVMLDNHDRLSEAAFVVEAGQTVPFVLGYHPSHWPARAPDDCQRRLDDTLAWWRRWIADCRFPRQHRWFEAVARSLVTLKTMSFEPSGGVVAAPTTSLPEKLGGVRNWDYRYCWIRDATLALYALLQSGFRTEAGDWRRWLLRAAAGDPRQLQIMYGLHGERRLTESCIDWLPGYADSRPVRIGNAAHEQRQLDVPGELLDALHAARKHALQPDDEAWQFQRLLLEQLEQDWCLPDCGLWEVRGEPRHFTHSRIMCWVAFDRGIRAVEQFGLPGPVERWREVRAAIHADVCRHGWSEAKQSFVQSYGSEALDAALLLIGQLGFLPADDPRFRSTVEAIERELLVDGFVLRYRHDGDTDDGLPAGEGVFLACSFWLADAWVLLDRRAEAEALFERLLGLANDVGLLSEEYNPTERRLLGNFPQAFTHIALINTAHNLATEHGPAAQRAERDGPSA